MSANRKLQTEIQQVLKKLEEGLVVFDDIWEKVYAAAQQSLKEKYESDLKKEIKKLQRLRDQIKSWLGNPDVKDKAGLIEARKIIESKMEQFKVCEKDTKSKAPRDGILREYRDDPKEAERDEKRTWLSESVERLEGIVETINLEIEKAASSKGKSKNKDQLELLGNRLKKNQWHISKLEQILNIIEDIDFDPNRLDSIKEDVEFYIESAIEDDGALGIDDEFNIYEELQLDSLALNNDEPELAVELEIPKPSAISDSDSGKAVTPKKAATLPSPVSLLAGVANVGKPIPVARVAPAIPAAKAPVTPKLTPAAALVKPSQTEVLTSTEFLEVNTVKSTQPASLATKLTLDASKIVNKSPIDSKKLLKSPNTAATSIAGLEDTSGITDVKRTVTSSTRVSEIKVNSIETPKTISIDQLDLKPTVAGVQSQNNTAGLVMHTSSETHLISNDMIYQNLSDSLDVKQGSNSVNDKLTQHIEKMTLLPPSVAVLNQPNLSSIQANVNNSTPQYGGGNLSNTQQTSSTSLPPKNYAPSLSPEALAAVNMLRCSMVYTPENMDPDKNSNYMARNLYTNAHPSYPTQPPSMQENQLLFERLPMDALFFAFYYQPGTYQQFLAAKQLKKHSWRFHKKYLTWFQRHEEPKISSDEFEEGTYVYFDYESGWCQRIKSEFKFEYAYLEE